LYYFLLINSTDVFTKFIKEYVYTVFYFLRKGRWCLRQRCAAEDSRQTTFDLGYHNYKAETLP